MKTNPSLRLVEILADEFRQLHSEEPKIPQSDGPLIPRISLVAHRTVSGKTIGAEVPKLPDSDVKPNSFEAHRQKRFGEWLTTDAPPTTKSLHGRDGLEPLYEKCRDVNLLHNDAWLQDAPLRPFTQGLLGNFLVNYPKVIDAGALMPEQRADIIKLNALVLEDAFPEYLLRSDDVVLTALYQQMYSKGTSALCLSGGGIRSATFALGVVQSLSDSQIAPSDFTYMSTVSGGGYLGGWLSAWMKQEKVEDVTEQLKSRNAFPREAAPIRHLRSYSNYLTPLLGLFSADTWTVASIYIRNLIVNWLVLIPFLATVAALPWVLHTIHGIDPPFWVTASVFGLGVLMLIISDLFTKINPPLTAEADIEQDESFQKRTQDLFLKYCLTPGVIAFWCWSVSWYWFFYGQLPGAPAEIADFKQLVSTEWDDGISLGVVGRIAAVSLLFVAVEWLIFFALERFGIIPVRFKSNKGARLKEAGCLIFAGLLSGTLLISISSLLPLYGGFVTQALYTSLAFPLFLVAILFNSFVYEGLKSSFVGDAEREWTARYNSWFMIVGFGWAVMSTVILYGTVLVEQYAGTVLSTGVLTSYLTAYLGGKLKGNSKPQDEGKSSSWLSRSLPLIGFAALIILFVGLSFLDLKLAGWVNEKLSNVSSGFASLDPAVAGILSVLLLTLFLGIVGTVSSRWIDTNRFTLHAMYRSRLVRAYLGASRPAAIRRPDPFTGFDESDNFEISKLAEPDQTGKLRRPFHIVNLALNLISGKNLAWQERKAAPFTVSALHAGSLVLGYRKTYMGKDADQKTDAYGHGIKIGTAMTISGAAVNPSSGYNTSPLIAFFMTLFNLRLGWWLGNPGPMGDETFNRSSPKSGIQPILSEMFGQTDEVNPYVMLSDGGHFENLGLYEMVLRRNKLIILSDASCDERCELEDLGNAIRKIRIDLGITIDFPQGFNIRSRSQPVDNKAVYWAVGRIKYPGQNRTGERDFENGDGILLYVKPAFYGNESKDLFHYASVNKAFPHESTADQFFSESQFESYRALGAFQITMLEKGLAEKSLSLHALMQAREADWPGIYDKLNKVSDTKSTIDKLTDTKLV